jgi:hypothetical protein
MAAMTDFLENKILDWLLRAQAIGITGASAGAGTGPTTLYVGLFTTAPTDSTAGTEVTGGSYARVSVTSGTGTWNNTQGNTSGASTGTDGTTENVSTVTFPAPTANWGVVTSFGIFDASSGGNLLIYAALTTSKTINNGDAAPSFAAGALTFQVDN